VRDVLPEIERWLAEGQKVALATVVETWGSAPRPLGSKMAISSAGGMAGSVSGGCVEGAVFEEAQSVLSRGRSKSVGYGVSDETAWSVGLSCGGRIEVFVEPLAEDELFESLRACLEDERLVARATVVAGPGTGGRMLIFPGGETEGALGGDLGGDLGSDLGSDLDDAAKELAEELFATFAAARRTVELPGGEAELFVEVHAPRRRLVIVGAVHVAVPLVTFAKALGFHTVIVDPRTAFATAERFAHADEVLTLWPGEALRRLRPDEGTYVALLSHDLKLDLPALEAVLRGPARYVGALGSKKTHAKRVAALEEAGFSAAEIARIHNPIGLDLGGRRAEEIAVAVAAELVAVDHGRRTR